MYCRTGSCSLNWSRGESSFLCFQNGCWFGNFFVFFAGGRISGGSVLQFKVFGLEVGSSAFPTSFRRVVRFVASWTFWILFLGILSVISALVLLSFEFSAVIFDMSGFYAIVASNGWIDARGKKASSRSCCCRGSGHCWYWDVVHLVKSIEFKLTF